MKKSKLMGLTLALMLASQKSSLGAVPSEQRQAGVVVDRDVLTVAADELKDVKVLQTFVSGRSVYDHFLRERNQCPVTLRLTLKGAHLL